MSIAIRFRAEPLRSLAFGSTSAAYMSVGTELDSSARIILVQNLTDQQMLFSFDGVTDHFTLPSEGFMLLDITGNRTISTGFFIAEGTQLFVKWANSGGPSPSFGAIYFSAFHGETM